MDDDSSVDVGRELAPGTRIRESATRLADLPEWLREPSEGRVIPAEQWPGQSLPDGHVVVRWDAGITEAVPPEELVAIEEGEA